MAPKDMVRRVGEGIDLEEFSALVKDEADKRLHIVDVFTHWCGPCASLVPTFKNLQVNIDQFEDRVTVTQIDRTEMEKVDPETHKDRFPETSKPRFLFYKAGQEIAYVEGLKAPEILKFINENMPPLDVEE
mmetsp:Transcript_50165/g.129384  ORF Transcript_50165/g.129384 Transcript_50165/m.129384 type:complete len:131 (+) Transcript_50165:80-472(+)|eukprot:CAMPEP_0195102546 /NCGR_PEP_ID=MMETSP0448-20130528/68316_1 /TAXON_ID=66468 /ORGANISM="Heterocapsa triquestra, Strain CCMP 448" /LENGTH=130 /DNA_ID=CAMNT_0040138063 /DNA_START=79 /DNA_END=471 /DNA_ORIENTATION=+